MLMQLLKVPQLSHAPQPTAESTYEFVKPPMSKKKLALIAGGILLLLIMLFALIFSGGGEKPGYTEMKTAMQSNADALGVIEEYEKNLNYAPSKNNVALTQILIRGNYQELNTRYTKLYKPKKRFNSNPKPDVKSQETLDAAVRNNTLDTEIIDVLRDKVTKSGTYFNKARKVVVDKELSENLKTAEKDMSAILVSLDKTTSL